MQRREALQLITATVLSPALGTFVQREPGALSLAPDDDEFLNDMQRRGCLYFAEQVGAKSGQVLDRAVAANTNGRRDPRVMASIAATGFGLTALCIAEKRGYQPRAQVLAQVRRTLRFHLEDMPHEHGFLYHFNDVDLGGSFGGSEVSSIDTSLLLCGALTARAHFRQDAEIVRLATALYERVDWPWMLNSPQTSVPSAQPDANGKPANPREGTVSNAQTFSMGWKRGAFIPSRWNHYSELMMLYLLAIGSPTHPIDPACWDAFSRPKISYAGFEFIGGADPLFVHQFSHAWFDFRYRRDKYADYFANSILATRAHKTFCLNLGKPYNSDYWGISASDSRHGYTAWGGPGTSNPKDRGFGGIDGSVVPNATAGSLSFLPADCLRVLRSLKDRYGKEAYGRYGFCDAFFPDAQWYDPDVLGIDLGVGLVMAENLRSGFVWDTFKRNPEVELAMKRAGFNATR